MQDLKHFLEHKAYNMRYWSLVMTSEPGSGHATSALSAADLIAVLFFKVMRYNPEDYADPRNDRFILSKGHAVPVLYAAWKEVGVLTEQDVLGYRRIDSVLEGHPTLRFSHNEAATGSLGIGLSIGVGEALAARMNTLDYRTYVMMGDSEVSEGSVWEAVQLAAYYKLDNLTAIIDCNRLGQSTQTMEGHDTARYQKMFEAFGWHALVINGHEISEITNAFQEAQSIKNKPTIIIAKTYKGYGVDEVEDKEGFHGKPIPKKDLPRILEQLKKRFSRAADYNGSFNWQPQLPQGILPELTIEKQTWNMPEPSYTIGDKIATRKAYGDALTVAGSYDHAIVSLDAEVKNSTYAEEFEARFKDRFIQCFIAEQNMVGMGIGLDRRGKHPFISTFGCFLTRAHDQIRMGAIGQSALKIMGSHAGVSIGEDGPSQMALEDIAMMRALPESIVLYPSDAVSAWYLVGQMAQYTKGISYLRTTRGATNVLYKKTEQFPIGGLKILKKDNRDCVCIVAAGITVHEALKAYELLVLEDKPIFISIIDLYSVKPLDADNLLKCAKESKNKILVVEDHYKEGGIGETVTAALINSGIIIESLAVMRLPRSGKQEELLAYEHIDANAIVQKIRLMI